MLGMTIFALPYIHLPTPGGRDPLCRVSDCSRHGCLSSLMQCEHSQELVYRSAVYAVSYKQQSGLISRNAASAGV